MRLTKTQREKLATLGQRYLKSADPTVNDDSSAGYGVWDKWLNQTSGEAYVCTDATEGAAVWQNISLDTEDLAGLFDAKADKDTLHTIAAASGATELDREDGSVFDVTATADISISYANFETVDGLVIYATNWGAHTITLPAGTEFGGGTGPEFTVAGTDIIVVTTKDGGTTTEFLVAEQDVKEAS
jgi:hypothetical protein